MNFEDLYLTVKMSDKDRVRQLEAELFRKEFIIRVLKHVILTETKLNPDDVIKRETDGVLTLTTSSPNLICVARKIGSDVRQLVFDHNIDDATKTPFPARRRYRAIKDLPPTQEVLPEPIMASTALDTSSKETRMSEIEKVFEELESSRTYRSELAKLPPLYRLLMDTMTLSEFKTVTSDHYSRLQAYFKPKTSLSQPEVSRLISSALHPFQVKMMRLKGFSSVAISNEDFRLIREVLNAGDHGDMTPFNSSTMIDKVSNHAVAMFPLEFILEKTVPRNLAYFRNVSAKSTDEDPYAYYSFSGENKGRRWDMQCRLHDIAKEFSTGVFGYCVSLFRALYFDLYKDNAKRDGWNGTHPELDQLFINTKLVSSSGTIREVLRKLVKQVNTLTPTENDKFNLKGDDITTKGLQTEEEIEMDKVLFDASI